MPRPTPLHARTAPLVTGNDWRRWSGYAVASAYDTVHDREYAAIRSSAALFDISPLHKYMVSGKDAARLLDRTVTRDVYACAIGRVFYTTWCDEHGKVIDDGTVARLDEQRFRLTSAEPALRWLHMNGAGMDVQIEDISDSCAALALQGPLSRDILVLLSDADVAKLGYFRLIHTKLRGIPVALSRTGYTGDLGYEIFLDADRAVELWDALMSAGKNYGVTPAGIWALDVARIEAGLLMGGVDYHSAHHALINSQLSSPYELNLGWTVNPRSRPFNGAQALTAERARAAAWRFVGVDIDWPSLEELYAAHGLPPSLPGTAWRASVPIYSNGSQVGYASSGCWSPLLKKYIALAHVRAPHFEQGTRVGFEVTVEHERKLATATITNLPFLDLPRKRA